MRRVLRQDHSGPQAEEEIAAGGVVPGAGFEPAWPCGLGILSPLRLPVPPPGRVESRWRRGSESNRRPRLCRPLHDHSATPPGALRPGTARASNAGRSWKILERERSLELPTLTLGRLRSTN